LSTKERPRVLDGKTVKVKTGLGNLYVTVNFLDSQPFEVFVSIGKCGQSIMAKAEAIAKLCSLLLRSGVEANEISKQLTGIVGEHPTAQGDTVIQSIPDAVGKVLTELNNQSLTRTDS
jgi:ribonucleoside-diphosphate reductase alpha chain